jgi:hypothetical protein
MLLASKFISNRITIYDNKKYEFIMWTILGLSEITVLVMFDFRYHRRELAES